MKKQLLNYIVILLFSTFVVRILNFIKEIQISYFYGTGSEVDNYNIVLIIPNIMLNSIGPALGLIIIALISKETKKIYLQKKDIYFLTGIALVLFGATIILVKDFQSYSIYYVVLVNLLTLLYFVQVSLVYYLQSFNEFKIGSISSLLQIVMNIFILFISFYYIHSFVLIFSLIVGLLGQITFLIMFIIKKDYFYTISISSVKENDFIHPVMSMILGFGLVEIVLSSQKFFLSQTNVEGVISSLNYAYKIMNLPISIFLFAILTGLFPTLIKIKDKYEFQKYFKSTLNVILLLIAPISIYFYVFSYELVSFLFERGEFSSESTSLTSFQLKNLSLLILPLSILTIFLRFLYIEKKWSIIYLTTGLILLIHFITNISFIKLDLIEYSVLSIPVSFSIGLIFCYIKIKTSLFNFEQLKILIGAVLFTISALLLHGKVEGVLSLIFVSILLFSIYIVVQIFMKNKTISLLKGIIK